MASAQLSQQSAVIGVVSLVLLLGINRFYVEATVTRFIDMGRRWSRLAASCEKLELQISDLSPEEKLPSAVEDEIVRLLEEKAVIDEAESAYPVWGTVLDWCQQTVDRRLAATHEEAAKA